MSASLDFQKMNVPRLEESEIRDIADQVRHKYWGDGIPVDVELIAEKGFDLTFTPVPGLKQLANTEAFLLSTLDEIVCEINSPEVRLRFSIAHELGHKVLHPAQVALLRPTSYENWKQILDTIPMWIWKRMEYQANEFAGRLLVPRGKLIDSLKHTTCQKLLDKVRETLPDADSQALYPYIAKHICKDFNVSDNAMKIRLQVEGIDLFSL
ncbi:MAG: ImmA/IrrE family metallo-endopeptidase [Bacteroidota bacterium]